MLFSPSKTEGNFWFNNIPTLYNLHFNLDDPMDSNKRARLTIQTRSGHSNFHPIPPNGLLSPADVKGISFSVYSDI